MDRIPSAFDDNFSQTHIKSYLDHPPPQYAEATLQRNSRVSDRSERTSSKANESVGLNSGPWLLRRTSIVVETEPSDAYPDESRSLSRVSSATTRIDEEKNDLRRNIFKKNGHRVGQESLDFGQTPWHTCQEFDTGFGVKVFIEAGKPKRGKTDKHQDMKGLEQAASVKRWPGGGRPAEAWGKLARDPELWDPKGDTLIYFGYQRPQPSFRVKSSMVEDVGSEILTQKLQEGRRRPGKPSSMASSSNSSARRGLSNLSIGKNSNPPPAPNPDARDPDVRYEIYFPAPSDASRIDVLRYHITTRNFFALLLAKPLVGLTYYQALVDLHQRLQLYMPGDPNCALIIIKCLMENSLHNVCDDPAAAAGLLAWSEDEEVCWQEGWREGFVHCSGMYPNLRHLPEFRDVSHTSRALLERAHLERQVRLQEVEDRLITFNFTDMWPESTNHLRTVHASFDNFRRFLRTFYEKQFKAWPPRVVREDDGTWLSRSLVSRLQDDFDALYDHFVDREIIWTNAKEGGNERSRGPVCRKASSIGSHTTDSDFFLAEIFRRFDQKHKYTHIPHPYPLLPATGVDANSKNSKSSIFGSKSKALEKRVAHAYAEASNIPTLRRAADFASNALVEAFAQFEKTDHPTEFEPRAARQGRWMLLYGLLQALSRISVDTPDLYFAGDVSYFLNPRLKGTPPWSYGSGTVYEEAEAKMSHVWSDY